MEFTTKQKVVVSVLALAVSFGCGWWATPTKVVTKTVTQQVIHEVVKQDTEKDVKAHDHKVTKTTETIKPDGTKVIQTITSDQKDTDSDTSKKTDTDIAAKTTTTSEKTVERDRGSISLSALAGFKMNDITGGPVYGAHVEKRVLGPITVGIFGLSDTTGGISVGLTF